MASTPLPSRPSQEASLDAAIIAQGVMAVLTMIETLLPQLGTAANTVSIVDGVINSLVKIVPVIEQLAPIVGNEIQLMYQGVKNIIANLKGTDTTAQQDAALDALDAQVDASWNSVAAQFDPDAAAPPTNAAPATGATNPSS